MSFLNVKDGQFKTLNHSFGPSIICKVAIAGKRFLKWGPTGLEGEQACLQDYPIPDGWNLTYDLDVTIDGAVYRLTIHQAAVRKAFQPYLNMLAADNRRVEEVTTLVTASISQAGRTSLKFSLA